MNFRTVLKNPKRRRKQRLKIDIINDFNNINFVWNDMAKHIISEGNDMAKHIIAYFVWNDTHREHCQYH